MSGFTGYLHHGGHGGMADALCREMLGRCAHRGPHGLHVHCEGAMALGHAWLDATGDGPGPWQWRDSGPVLSGDLSLTNARALCAELGISEVSDGAAILAAYDRWGRDCLARLEGEFAFVLWDPERRRLLGARDRFGVKPFVYHAAPRGLAVASEIGPVLAVLGSDPQPDERWIAAYLSGYVFEAHRTAYRGVERLPPGHLLCLEGDRVTIEPWWVLEPDRVPVAEAPEALHAALSDAVSTRMRGGPVGSMLSGGLDSSTVSCLAARASVRPVPALSLRYSTRPELDEGAFIDAVRSGENLLPCDIDVTQSLVLDDIEGMLAQQEQPFLGYGSPMMRHLLDAAQAQGLRVILSGHGGDEVIGKGQWHFAELARRGKWMQLWTLTGQFAAFTEARRSEEFNPLLRHYGPRPLRALLRRLAPEATSFDPYEWRALVNSEFAERVDLVAIARAARLPDSADDRDPELTAHLNLLRPTDVASGFEVLDRAAAHRGLEPRYPFYDRHVVALCVGQPSAAKIAQGRPRSLLRAAMRDVLPASVCNRHSKMDFTRNFWAGMRADPTGQIEGYCHAIPERLAPYVDAETLHQAAERALKAPEPDTTALRQVWRALWLDNWLARLSNSSQATPVPMAQTAEGGA